MNESSHDQAEFQALARAIAQVVKDYRAEMDPDASVEEAIAHTRAEVEHDDIVVLASPAYGEPIMSLELAAAYRQVLDAPDEALTPAVTSHAEGVLDGTFDYDSCPSEAYGDPTSSDEDQGDDDSEGDPAEIEVLGTEDEPPRRELDARREPLELIEVAESCNAALACAAATAAATEAAARARAAGDEDAVALVIVEDVEAACDEDGGF